MSGTVRAAVAGRGGQRASVRERAGREGAGGNEFLYIGLHSNLKLVLGELLSLTALILQLLVAFVKKKKTRGQPVRAAPLCSCYRSQRTDAQTRTVYVWFRREKCSSGSCWDKRLEKGAAPEGKGEPRVPVSGAGSRSRAARVAALCRLSAARSKRCWVCYLLVDVCWFVFDGLLVSR